MGGKIVKQKHARFVVAVPEVTSPVATESAWSGTRSRWPKDYVTDGLGSGRRVAVRMGETETVLTLSDECDLDRQGRLFYARMDQVSKCRAGKGQVAVVPCS
jgi:hypothetical protein